MITQMKGIALFVNGKPKVQHLVSEFSEHSTVGKAHCGVVLSINDFRELKLPICKKCQQITVG